MKHFDDLTVKNKRKVEPRRKDNKGDYERDREPRIPKSPRKQPKWILQQEED